VYYLLAFDEQTVLDVLTSTELAGGDRPRALAYLEKMVQVRLDLPPVHPRLAGRLLDQLLDGLIAKHNVTLDDRAAYRLGHAYRTHLASYLHEPRQVKRYCAQIEALYPLLATEVDFVDFAIVTFFRTFHPGVAGLLASHKEELTGTALEFDAKPTHEQRRDAWQARLREAGVAEADLGPVLDLLGQLFLPIKSALERMEYGSSFHPEMTAARRVGSSEYFDRYFHLGIGPDDLPDATIAAALNEVLAGAAGDSWAAVLALLSTNAELVLDKLRRLAPATPEAASLLLPALAAIAADVPDSGFLGRARIVHHFWVADLLQLAEPADVEAFVRELADLSDVRFVADSCARAKRSAEKNDVQLGAPFGAISVATVKLLKEDLVRQATLRPEQTAGVVSMLADWEALEPGCDRQGWMRSTIESGAWPLPDVLGIFVPTGTSSTGEGPSRAALGDTELGFLDQVLGIEYAAAQLDPTDDLGEEPFFSDYDVSWESRVRRASRAVARWIAANRPSDASGDEQEPEPDDA
jgi:hypothetical protein